MSLAEKQQQLSERLLKISNPQERFNALVLDYRGKNTFPAALKNESHRIEGCLSKLWFSAEELEGRCYFQSDSDSLVVKAVAGLLCDFYSGELPAEIARHDPGFLKALGITQHLTVNRRNGLSNLWDRIHGFALSKMPGTLSLAQHPL